MAKLKAFCAQDLKLNTFTPPMFFLHTGQMLRQWQELVNDSSTVMGRHPLDFRLVQVGEFDDSTGVFEPAPPHVLASPGEYLKSGQQELPGIAHASRAAKPSVAV